MSWEYQYTPKTNPGPTPMDLEYQKQACRDAINTMRDLTDMSDEQIFDEITESCDLSDFEKQFLADELGI